MKIKSILITVVLSIAILCSAVYPLGFISAQTAQNRVQLEQQIIQLLNQIIVQLRGELALILSQQSTSPILVQSVGQYSGFYNFPSSFFSQTYVSEDQMVKITDGQYLGLKDMHNGISPYNFCRIEYSPAVYGATTSSGIKLGDSAFSGLNSSNPRWAVMGHEQGHNFFGGTSQFYMTMSAPGPFLQESLAVLSSFYAYHYILDNSDSLDINQIGLYKML